MASRVTPSKRPFQKNSSEHNGRGKWQKTKHTSSQKSQLKIQPGVPIFRILCPSSKSGSLIGKGGGVIAKIRQETRVKIRVDDSRGCDERVIVITAFETDNNVSREQDAENDGGVAVSAVGDREKDKDNSKEGKENSENDHVKEEKDDSEKDHSKEGKDDSETDHIKEEKDNSEKDHIKEEKDVSEKDHVKEEKDDSEKDHVKEEKDDSEKDHSKEGKDDSEKDHIIKEEKDDAEEDHIKEENNDAEEENKEGKDDSDKDHIKEENNDPEEDNNQEKDEPEKDNSTEEKGDLEKEHSKNEQDDPEKDHIKEEKDDPFAAQDARSEPEKTIPSVLKAVLLVFDSILAIKDENETGDSLDSKTPVSFRLLVPYSQAGWLLGKSGSVVKQMSVDSGCEIRISKDNLPSCALLQDKLCQITGEVDSVRKGLKAVAEVLFAHPPKESDLVAAVRSSGSSSRSLFNQSGGLPSGMKSNFHVPFQGPSQANGPFDIMDLRPNITPFPPFPEAPMHGHASIAIEPLTFRLLCSKDKVGSVIGKGGNIVNTIQKDTGCEIKVLETIPKSDDRIISISGPAHPGDGISPAQNAILHVQRKIALPSSDKKEGPATCRLIVSPNQVGCLLGKGGSIIAEMRKLSGAHILVLSKDKIPRGVPENDEVVQISGNCEAIQEALMQITARLRNHLFRDRMPAVGPNTRPPFGSLDPQFGPYMGNHESPSLIHKDFIGRPLDGISAPWTAKGMHDVGDPMTISDIPGSAHRGPGGFSGPSQSSMVPNLTAEVLVPRLVIPALCGEDGGCLDRIREFSEAKITVTEPIADAMDIAILVSGTPDQMHAARSLIQAFVISESFTP
ncbi:hypothetical protein ACP70R_030762 [Stipagrostis hirtigluma subsp. patula]